jgi:hypothetical protein
MSRKVFGVLSLYIAALLVPTAGLAQISFVPGTERKVPNGPQFIASGDFNNDGIQDAVVASTVRDDVTVLFGSPDANFSSVVQLPVGRLLRDVAVGDFNGDRLPDIAVADNFQGGVFLIYGAAGATFSTPQFFAGQARGPYDLATGRFDVGTTLDLVTTNYTRNTFTVFTNEGGTRGLRSRGNFPTGSGPRSIIAANLNGDAFDDLIVLDTRTRGTDELSVYLNQGNGTFQGIVPISFVVGIGAVAFTPGDFNRDGKLDLAVLSNNSPGHNTFQITVLLGSVNPMFDVLPPVTYGCPARLNGIPIFCTPQDIKAADFDSDTLIDLAISFSTRAISQMGSTSGFVNAYAGRGNGTFDFGTQIIVGLGPKRIIAADVTGDAVPDVVVTESTSNTVRVLRSKTPPKKALGIPCVVGTQCDSGSCVDGVCCGTAACQAGQRCDVLPGAGSCKPPAPNGTECSIGDQCSSHFCVDGFCCGSRSCAPLFCNTGECAPPASNGTPCHDPAQCGSGFCTDGVCCSSELCAANAACNIPGSEGLCMVRLTPGNPCTDDRQCCTDALDPTNCDPSFCRDGFCCEEDCPADQTCGGPATEGICVARPTMTTTPRPTPTVTRTPTPAGKGSSCNTGSNCESGNCVDGRCCDSPSCSTGQSCSVPGHLGECTAKNPIGLGCNGPQDCNTGYCRPDGICDAPPTATPTPIPTKVPAGGPCNATSQCQGVLVCNITEGGVCCNSTECPSGQSCRTSANPGFCTTIPPTPTPLRQAGDPCSVDAQCDTGLCTDSVCCVEDQCTRPDRCDIFGFKGDCAPPLPEGFDCEKNADCESNHCDPRTLICSPPPSPTPPIDVPEPPTPTPQTQLIVSRSGGCSIGDGQSTSNGAFLLGALPLAFWMRRRVATELVRNRRK